jgi:hypothetical protein
MTRKCPACKIDNDDAQWRCGACGTILLEDKKIINNLDLSIQNNDSNLLNSFTIENFLKDNYHLFTIIGVLGTMLALLPTLAFAIFGDTWLTGDLSIFSIFLVLVIFFGGSFIAIIFYIILRKIFEGQNYEGIEKKFGIIEWHTGDSSRYLLTFCLSIMVFGVVIFLFSSTMFFQNFYAKIIGLSLVFIVIPAAFNIIIGYNLAKIIYTISSEDGKTRGKRVAITLGLYSIVIIIFLVIALFISPGFLIAHQYSDSIKINPSENYYSPAISTSKGLQLDVTNISSDQLLSTSYNWSTNYGYFISIIPSTKEVSILGDTIETGSTRIYWTFSISDISINKSPVTIKLQIKNLRDKTIITNTSLNLTWFEKDIAYVNYSYSAIITNSSKHSNLTCT